MLRTTSFAMLFANEVWAMYGIAIEPEVKDLFAQRLDGRAVSPTTSFAPPTAAAGGSTHATTSVTATLPFDHPSATGALQSFVPVTFTSSIPSNPTSTTHPAQQLDTGVKIGIGVVAGVLGLAFIVLIVGACYLRRKWREKALERAVQEVERGEGGLTKGSEEIIVLESRVSIIFDDVSEDEDEEDERGRGRNGLSLPRRMY